MDLLKAYADNFEDEGIVRHLSIYLKRHENAKLLTLHAGCQRTIGQEWSDMPIGRESQVIDGHYCIFNLCVRWQYRGRLLGMGVSVFLCILHRSASPDAKLMTYPQ
jgi:hypothetical protein